MSRLPPETSIEKDLRRLRGELKRDKSQIIKMACFNQAEADELRAGLTEDQRKRVHFTWIEFGKFGGLTRRGIA